MTSSSRFAKSDEDAKLKYHQHKSRDPFPEIDTALLNSADIEDYVAATGMIYPFDPSKLISASYEVPFDGEVYQWDGKVERDMIKIADTGGFTLKQNSIAYVWLNTTFRLPDYIALRFNLVIKHVHKGILLGTGPLVDPGYEGKLLIPLHNLTSNEYRFSEGEGLIWVEFTKISKNQRWVEEKTQVQRLGQYRPMPQDKKNRDPKYFFEKAVQGRPIRSSIPEAVRNSAEKAEEAKKSAQSAAEKSEQIRMETESKIDTIKEEWRSQISRIQWITILASIVAIGSIVTTVILANRSTMQLVESSIKYVNDVKMEFQTQQKQMLEKMEYLENRIQSYEKDRQQDQKASREKDSELPGTQRKPN
jgi:deoxycytidine triphosphate deaminase